MEYLTKNPVDILGCVTDAEIDAQATALKKVEWEKRHNIIDSDIMVLTHNYEMLDRMSYKYPRSEKKKYLVWYIKDYGTDMRKGPDYRGRMMFGYSEKFKGKPVDDAMAERLADYILSIYANEEGVLYRRHDLKDGCYQYLDANGRCVQEVKYENHKKLLDKYMFKLFVEKFPYEENKNMYFSGKWPNEEYQAGKKGTYDDCIICNMKGVEGDVMRAEALDLARQDPEWIELVPFE